MTLDRIKWKQTFDRRLAPSWPCPSCNAGILLIKTQSIKTVESTSSKAKKSNDSSQWYPLDEHGRFIGQLECNRPSCQESVVIAGTYGYDLEFDSDGTASFEQYLKLSYIDPAPHPFNIPTECPPDVAESLRDSFQLFWIDANAAANKVRVAVEYLMDFIGIKTRIRTKKGKYKLLTLHERIEVFRGKRQDLGDLLLAVKWLGNFGSHKEKLKKDDVLDAFEIIDHVLQELIAKRPKKMALLAKQINKKKGPRSKARSKGKKV